MKASEIDKELASKFLIATGLHILVYKPSVVSEPIIKSENFNEYLKWLQDEVKAGYSKTQ